MPSPVDPSRRTALADALREVGMIVTARQVETGEIIDLEVIRLRLNAYDDNEPLTITAAIEAGEYGPYQESGEPGAAV